MIEPTEGQLPVEYDNRKTVVNMVPEVVAQSILNVPVDYLPLEEDELERLLHTKEFTSTDRRLRLSFWKEHASALQGSGMMNMANVYAGICSKNHFYCRFLHDPVRVAYLVLPPIQYDIALRELIDLGVKKIIDVFDLPVKEVTTDGKTKYYPKNADIITKAFLALYDRVNGSVVQRVEQKNLNVNVDAKKDSPLNMDDIEKKLRELEGLDTVEVEVGEQP